MRTSPSRMQPIHVERQRRDTVGAGVGLGLKYATVFSAFVLLMAVFRRSTTYHSYGGFTTWHVVGFYYAVGVAGGALFGLLQSWRRGYVGKVLVAYLMLFLVYGGGSTGVVPMVNESSVHPLPLWYMLALWAIACGALAPVYVAMSNKSAP